MPGKGTEIPHAQDAAKPKGHSYGSPHALEPVLCNEATAIKNLHAATREKPEEL